MQGTKGVINMKIVGSNQNMIQPNKQPMTGKSREGEYKNGERGQREIAEWKFEYDSAGYKQQKISISPG